MYIYAKTIFKYINININIHIHIHKHIHIEMYTHVRKTRTHTHTHMHSHCCSLIVWSSDCGMRETPTMYFIHPFGATLWNTSFSSHFASCLLYLSFSFALYVEWSLLLPLFGSLKGRLSTLAILPFLLQARDCGSSDQPCCCVPFFSRFSIHVCLVV